jgi:hypothetical protein
MTERKEICIFMIMFIALCFLSMYNSVFASMLMFLSSYSFLGQIRDEEPDAGIGGEARPSNCPVLASFKMLCFSFSTGCGSKLDNYVIYNISIN